MREYSPLFLRAVLNKFVPRNNNVAFGRYPNERRCLYCGDSLIPKHNQYKLNPIIRELQGEASKAAKDAAELSLYIERINALLKTTRKHERETLLSLLPEGVANVYWQHHREISRLGHKIRFPVAVDHIRPQAWDGKTRPDNIFLDVCADCNGTQRGAIPFPYWVNGLNGIIHEDTYSGKRTFVVDETPRLTAEAIQKRQQNIAGGLIRLIMSDARIPAPDSWIRRSFFLAAIPNMLYLPNNPLTKQNLGERLKLVFQPIFDKQAKFFTSPQFEMYLHMNKYPFGEQMIQMVQTLISDVVHPLRKQLDKRVGKITVLEEATVFEEAA